MRPFVLTLILTMSLAAAACAATPAAAAPDGHDRPVPPDEPRATVALSLDLPRTSSCEETFDLALYASGGVELVEWDPATSCIGRTARVRYLPKRVGQAALLDQIKRLASRVEVLRP